VSRQILGLMFATTFLGVSTGAFAAPYVERDGRYEINWSTGKVRFYGVAKPEADDGDFRSAEQRAWANGLKAAEKNIPVLLSGRLGKVSQTSPDKLSKLAASTTSVSTTYFGDQRVKVLLESPVHKITPQLTLASPNGAATATVPVSESGRESGSESYVVVRLPKSAKPVAFVQILDDAGREMLSPGDVAKAANDGAGLSRWYRREIAADAFDKSIQPAEIHAEYSAPGVLKVAASAWRPEYAAAITAGRGIFVVE
jgi:hypothetical protein